MILVASPANDTSAHVSNEKVVIDRWIDNWVLTPPAMTVRLGRGKLVVKGAWGVLHTAAGVDGVSGLT